MRINDRIIEKKQKCPPPYIYMETIHIRKGRNRTENRKPEPLEPEPSNQKGRNRTGNQEPVGTGTRQNILINKYENI